MTAESNFEARYDRDLLRDNELDGVVAGADGNGALAQTLSSCLRMMADLQKAITGNIR